MLSCMSEAYRVAHWEVGPKRNSVPAFGLSAGDVGQIREAPPQRLALRREALLIDYLSENRRDLCVDVEANIHLFFPQIHVLKKPLHIADPFRVICCTKRTPAGVNSISFSRPELGCSVIVSKLIS